MPRACPHTSQLIVSVANKPLVSTLKTVSSVASIVSSTYGSSSYSSPSSSSEEEDLQRI